MYRLIDDLARCRLLYPPPVPSLPGVMLIDLPERNRGPGLLLDRYYAVVVENEEEAKELAAFLAAPRAGSVAPNLLNRRPSALLSDEILVVRFDPPMIRWPWLTLCRWPDQFTIARRSLRVDMARGCYTFEAFTDAARMDDYIVALVEALGKTDIENVRLVSADRLAPSGCA